MFPEKTSLDKGDPPLKKAFADTRNLHTVASFARNTKTCKKMKRQANLQRLLLADNLPFLEHDCAVLRFEQRHSPEEKRAWNVKNLGVQLGQRAAELEVLRSLLLLQPKMFRSGVE